MLSILQRASAFRPFSVRTIWLPAHALYSNTDCLSFELLLGYDYAAATAYELLGALDIFADDLML